MTPLAAVALAGCLAVNPFSDRISAADFAAAVPGLVVAVPEAPVAFAPAPGVQRTYHLPELLRLASRLQWNVQPAADICFERPVSAPDPALLLAAMHKSLPQADITVLEYSRLPIPAGDIQYPAAGLRPSGDHALWKGYVQYAGNRRFLIWARVQALVTVNRVVAAADLPAGQPLRDDQLRLETRKEIPPGGEFAESVEAALGRCPLSAIRAGTALRLAMLQNPKDVLRGETVIVDVRNGAAHLELEARAEASGSIGQTIPVFNPDSHKRFVARVEGKGRVSVGSAVKVNP